jgi:glycosyltransferase involved in cell wall biosynthesis
MKKITISVINDLATDQRVYRTCSLLIEMGFSITLIGRKLPNSLPINRPYKTKRFKFIINKGPLFYLAYNIRLFFYLLFTHQDILWANDLDTLLANSLISWIKNKPLIYDSHELFTETAEVYNRKLVKKIWEVVEKIGIRHVDTFITVNESIANIYKNKYNKPIYVVRNLPIKMKNHVYKPLKLKKNDGKYLIIMQGSGINIDRGYEEAVLAMKYIDNAILYIIGSGDVIDQLKSLAIKENLTDKVVFVPKLPYVEMMKYTTSADLGLSLDKPICLNYLYSLPNKLFDYIQANIPIIASDLPEIRKIIEKYEIGIVIDNIDPKKIAETIKRILKDKEVYEKMKENLKIAADELVWEKEKEILKIVLQSYM